MGRRRRMTSGLRGGADVTSEDGGGGRRLLEALVSSYDPWRSVPPGEPRIRGQQRGGSQVTEE
jgi:hypothetical protein